MGECPWYACVRKDKRIAFNLFFLIRNAHIVERQEILEKIWFMFLLAPATAGHLVMLCLGVYDPQGGKEVLANV